VATWHALAVAECRADAPEVIGEPGYLLRIKRGLDGLIDAPEGFFNPFQCRSSIIAQAQPPGPRVSVIPFAVKEPHLKEAIHHDGHCGFIQAQLICNDPLRNRSPRGHNREHCGLGGGDICGLQDSPVSRFVHAVRCELQTMIDACF